MQPELDVLWDDTGEPTSQRYFQILASCEIEGQAGKLPQENTSFGPQRITATDYSCESSIEREFWLFYTKNATNHPMTGSLRDYDRNGGGPTPN